MTVKYDFAGWVTKHNTLCSDGLTITHEAFKTSDSRRVPLVWSHNSSEATNVLGHVELEHRAEGVYGYGYFNDTDSGKHSKAMVKHGDITAMSIGARNLKKQGGKLLHGLIYEVSLVMAGANPGALILEHSEMDDINEGEAIIFNDELFHTAEEEELLKHNDEGESEMGKTIGEVMETMNEEQTGAVEALIANILEQADEEMQQSISETEELLLKHNAFDQQVTVTAVGLGETLSHEAKESILQSARTQNMTLQQAFRNNEEVLQHGITDIEMLFPDAHSITNEPVMIVDRRTGAADIVNATKKSPFSRIKTVFADFTEDEARARGYIKGKEKLEQVFGLLKRETTPQTIYKKQKLDRDDIIDITDFDIVRFMAKEMRFMLIEELGRAVLVGDGRLTSDASHIKHDKIRPIISDDNFYTLKAKFKDAATFVESAILAMADYEGSGIPTCYIDPTLLTQVKLLKGTDGRFLLGHIPSDTEVAAMLGVSSIKATTLMKGKGALIVNLDDYTLGSTAGGQITNFNQFDIDFNQEKFLIETRLCGALTLPKSAVYLKEDPTHVTVPPAYTGGK